MAGSSSSGYGSAIQYPDLRLSKTEKRSSGRRQFMTMRVRWILMLLAGLAVIGLAGCGHYTCGTGFGSSTCTSSGPPNLGGGGGSSAASAFAFAADADGTIDGYTLSTAGGTF